MGCLYRHVRADKDEVFYIGISMNTKRPYDKNKRNRHWKHVISKTDYIVEILFEHDDFNFLKLKEIEFISLYGRKDTQSGTLVNMTDGGDGSLGNKHTEEWKENARIRGKLIVGPLCSNYGKKIPADVRLKISIANTGKKRTPEQCKRISIAKTNPNKKVKIKKGYVSGENHPMWGKKHPKLSEAMKKYTGEKHHNSKKIINIVTGEVFSSLSETSKLNNINYSTLRSSLARNKINTTNFRYL